MRLVVFAEPRSFISNVLFDALLAEARRDRGVDVVAVCDTSRERVTRLPLPRLAAQAAVKRAFDSTHPIVLHGPMWTSITGTARRAGIPVVPAPDVNDAAFVDALRRDHRPDAALSLICLQIFGDRLLDSFDAAVNYHNGLLPAYRGLRTTAWSVYNGEPRTGFSFHRMNTAVDEGPIVHQDSVPVLPRASTLQLEWDKTQLAARAMHTVLAAMTAREAGVHQDGTAAYYSRRDSARITTIGDPATVTWDDLVRRVRAFGSVVMTLHGTGVRVTQVRRGGGSRYSFSTTDGVLGTATRLRYLPPALYRVTASVAAALRV